MLNEKRDKPFTVAQILATHHGVMNVLLHKEHTGQWRREPIVVREPRSSSKVVFCRPTMMTCRG